MSSEYNKRYYENVVKEIYITYRKAKFIAYQKRIKSENGWIKMVKKAKENNIQLDKSGKKIPIECNIVYYMEWISWKAFCTYDEDKIQSEYIRVTERQEKKYPLSFDELIKYARTNNITDCNHWKRHVIETGKASWLPIIPILVIKYARAWCGWPEFLGIKVTSTGQHGKLLKAYHLPFKEAKKRAQQIPLEKRCRYHWMNYVKARPDLITLPHEPDVVYKNHWKGWEDFLGTYKVGKLTAFVKPEIIKQYNFQSYYLYIAQYGNGFGLFDIGIEQETKSRIEERLHTNDSVLLKLYKFKPKLKDNLLNILRNHCRATHNPGVFMVQNIHQLIFDVKDLVTEQPLNELYIPNATKSEIMIATEYDLHRQTHTPLKREEPKVGGWVLDI